MTPSKPAGPGKARRALHIRKVRPTVTVVAAAVLLSSVNADPGYASPKHIATKVISVQLQAAADELALNTTAVLKTVTEPPTAAAAVASAVGPSEILAVLSNVVSAAVTVVGAAAWFAAFPITLPISFLFAQGASSQPLLGVLGAFLGGPGGTVVAFFGLPFAAVSIAVGEILSPLRNVQAAAIAAPRSGAARTPSTSMPTGRAARTQPAAAISAPARSSSGRVANKPTAAARAAAKTRHPTTSHSLSR